MSPRDLYWFLAGSLVATVAAVSLRTSFATHSLEPTARINTVAATQLDERDVHAAELISARSGAPPQRSAGSLEEVTQKLSSRLTTDGGTQEEWRLLAQSYDYMGRAQEAAAARAHISPGRP